MPAGLLGIEELDRAEIEDILARAKDFQPIQSQSLKKLDTLRGKMIVNLFYEASTRTPYWTAAIRWKACAWPLSAILRTAAWPGPTCICCPSSGRKSYCAARPRCCPRSWRNWLPGFI